MKDLLTIARLAINKLYPAENIYRAAHVSVTDTSTIFHVQTVHKKLGGKDYTVEVDDDGEVIRIYVGLLNAREVSNHRYELDGAHYLGQWGLEGLEKVKFCVESQ